MHTTRLTRSGRIPAYSVAILPPMLCPTSVDRRVGRPEVEQCVEVAEVVRKPVTVRGPLAAAESTPVRGHQRVAVGHRVDQELEGVAGVHEAVQQHDEPAVTPRPAGHVMAQAADHCLLMDRPAPGLIGLVHPKQPMIEGREHTRPLQPPGSGRTGITIRQQPYIVHPPCPESSHAQDPRLPARRLRTTRAPRPAAARIRLPHPLREFRPRAARRAGRAPLRRARGPGRTDERGPGRPATRTCAPRWRAIREAVVAGKPMLGICLGAQLLAAGDGRQRAPEPRSRDRLVSPAHRSRPHTTTGCSATSSTRPHFVFQWHAYTFAPPPGAVPLAWTRNCRNQAYRLGDAAWGLQFHLEADEALIGRWLASDCRPGGDRPALEPARRSRAFVPRPGATSPWHSRSATGCSRNSCTLWVRARARACSRRGKLPSRDVQMNAAIDVLGSTLASTLRLWRGTNARGAARQPAKHIELYEFEACPYCRLVREALTELDLDALIYPAPHGGKRFRPKVARLGGKQQFPFLVDPNSGESMYESADIIDYLYRRLWRAPGAHAPAAPARRLHVRPGLDPAPACRAAGPAPPGRQRDGWSSSASSRARTARRVRELLCELELPYLLRSTGKATLAGPRTAAPSRGPVPGAAGARTDPDRTARTRRQGAGALPGRIRTPTRPCSSRRPFATT